VVDNPDLSLSCIKGCRSIDKKFSIGPFLELRGHHRVFTLTLVQHTHSPQITAQHLLVVSDLFPFRATLNITLNLQRKPLHPQFYGSSRSKIGRQSFPNGVSSIAQQLEFDWLQPHSKDGLRLQLKKVFFPLGSWKRIRFSGPFAQIA